MNNLNSPFTMEHFGYIHIGWNHPFTKGPKNLSDGLAPKMVVPYCHKLVWFGGPRGGGGGGLTWNPPPPALDKAVGTFAAQEKKMPAQCTTGVLSNILVGLGLGAALGLAWAPTPAWGLIPGSAWGMPHHQ